MQRIKSFLGKATNGWLVLFVVLAIQGTGAYYWLRGDKDEDPDNPTPTFVGNLEVEHGSIVKLNVLPYKIKPAKLVSFDANWQVWTMENGKEVPVKFDVWPDGTIQFPARCQNRKFEVLTFCVYLYKDGDSNKLKTFLLKNFVQVGKGPNPPPDPDPPVPPPNPAPIPEPGFRVMMVYEANELDRLPDNQKLIFASTVLQQYLSEKCVKVNNHPEARFYDKDTDMTNESTIWQNAMKRPRTSIPWILISNGKTGFEGPLPANLNDTFILLKKFGG